MGTASDKYGRPGYDNGRSLMSHHGRVALSAAFRRVNWDWPQIIEAVQELMEEGSIDSITRAYEIGADLPRHLHLPPGTWCMMGRYEQAEEPNRDEWSVWAACYTKEQAEAWTKAYNEHFRAVAKRHGWSSVHRFEARQCDTASPGQLRHPDADPVQIVRAVHS